LTLGSRRRYASPPPSTPRRARTIEKRGTPIPSWAATSLALALLPALRFEPPSSQENAGPGLEQIEASCRDRLRDLEEQSRSQIKSALEILANNPPTSPAVAAACERLRALGAVVVPKLLEALRDPNANLSQGAALALGRMLEAPPADVDPKGIREDLFRVLQPSEPVEASRLALDVLGRGDDASLAARIEPFVQSKDDGIRVRALRFLGKVRAAGSIAAIVRALDDPTFEVRRAAVVALVSIKDPSTLPAILPHLDDQSYDVREVSYRAVGAMGDASRLPPLLAKFETLAAAGVELDKPDSIAARESRWCLDAIGAIGSWKALPALRRYAASEHEQFRTLVLHAMLAIFPRVRSDHDTAALDEILASLDVADPKVLDAAYAAIGAIGDERALPKLYEKMESADHNVVLFAVRTVGEIGEPKAAPRLKRKVRDRSNEIVRAAAKALALCGDRSEMDKLTSDYERVIDRNPKDFRANRSLGEVYKDVRLWKRAVPYFKTALGAASDAPTRGEMQLRLAECYSQLNDLESAAKAAQKAVSEGFVDVASLEKNPDLDNLRKSPRWRDVVSR
jgi:HEAT repeat protein